MNKTIEKKLLHFFTGGNIHEDFAAARTKKTAKLRQFIRACFYVHFAAAALCITLAAVLGAGTAGIVSVSICEVVLIGLAFLAVGDMTLIKTLLCCGDTAFAAVMFVAGALGANKAPFFAIGAVTAVMTLYAFGAYYAAMCREFLENFSPLSLRREHYTLLVNLSDSADSAKLTKPTKLADGSSDDTSPDSLPEQADEHSPDSSSDTPKNYGRPAEVITVPKTEIQVLADKLRDILCAPKNDKVAEAMPKRAAYENRSPRTENEAGAPVIPEAPGKNEVRR